MRHTTAGTGLRNPSRISVALAIGLMLAILGAAASIYPPVARLDTQLGLGLLFWLRGARSAPPKVVVISIDHESSKRLGLTNIPRKWPRSLHAQLIKQLNARGIRAIAFDVNFIQARDPAGDARFANAMRAAGNVVLFEYLRQMPPLAGSDSKAREKLVEPTQALAKAAAGLAPFPLPDVPAGVSQVWLFKDIGDVVVPTLPMLALQQYSQRHYPAFAAHAAAAARAIRSDTHPVALPEVGADLVAIARAMHDAFQREPEMAEAVRERFEQIEVNEAAATHRALVAGYAGPDVRYLDFYGPPRSITTVPYHAVLKPGAVRDYRGASLSLRDKMAFVGFSEKFHQADQTDSFETVFSQADGLKLSGVEIAATAFANLLEGRSVTPLPWGSHLLLIAIWGLIAGAVLLLLPGAMTVPAAVLLAIGGMGAAYFLFGAYGIWLPVIVPLLLQLPLALASALFGHYLYMRRSSSRLHETLAVYLPRGAVAQLAQPAAQATNIGRTMFGVCLATDIARYSALSEGLAPDALRALLNLYFERLFEPVRLHGGEVCDIKGDAMLAIWTEGRPAALREAACRAALDIFHAVDGFGRDLQGARLPTRIGLHCGRMELGTVGSGEHFEYRPVGDIVNTATRIEGLGKHLGAWLLASEEVVTGLDDVDTRELGCFQPAGKSTPLIVHEVLPSPGGSNPASNHNGAAFNQALKKFRAGDWRAARAAFTDYLSTNKGDGPANFYLRLSERYQRRPPADWDGIITLRNK